MNKIKRNFLILILAFATLNVYLFVNAPVPLPDPDQASEGKQLSVEEAFALLAQENDAARSLYTRAIVGDGKKVKLRFDEDWESGKVEAGPLPALFLRGTAAYLEKSPQPLNLFLGSDFPISAANKFSGIQEEYFTQMKEDKKPRYFFDENTDMHTAMFPDIASAGACVSCHNAHPDSPKKDWKLGDMMGATTWTFPHDSVSVRQMAALIGQYRQGAKHTYESYLKEVEGFRTTKKPAIGKRWPSEGYFLPASTVFMDSVSILISSKTLDQLLQHIESRNETK